MYISPPIAVLTILAVGLASTAWLPKQPRETAQATVILPTATYEKLALWGKEHISADGHPLAIMQVIEELAKTCGKDKRALGELDGRASKIPIQKRWTQRGI